MSKQALALAAIASLAGVGRGEPAFGDGRDGAMVVAANQSMFVGGWKDYTVTSDSMAGESSFALNPPHGLTKGRDVVITTLTGPNAGKFEFATVWSTTSNSVTFSAPLQNSYLAWQTIVSPVHEYTSVTLQDSARLWYGGSWFTHRLKVIAIRSQGPVVLARDAYIDGVGTGYAGGYMSFGGSTCCGYSYLGDSQITTSANGGGGGGGTGGTLAGAGGGGGGSYGQLGHAGTTNGGVPGGEHGTSYGFIFPAGIFPGSGGGGGGGLGLPTTSGGGGGGIMIIFAPSITLSPGARLDASGGRGEDGLRSDSSSSKSGGGGGSGGSILLSVSSEGLVRLDGSILAQGGAGGAVLGTGSVPVGAGGDGGAGRIHINGFVTGTGTVSPAATTGPGIDPRAAAAGWSAYE